METIKNCYYKDSQNVTPVRVDSDLSRIGEKAFFNCINLSYIELNNGLIEIDDYAFGNTAVEYIAIPDTVKCIGEGIFSGCKNLKTIKMPKEIITLSKNFLENCNSVREIYLPENLYELDGMFDHLDLSKLTVWVKKNSCSHEALIKIKKVQFICY